MANSNAPFGFRPVNADGSRATDFAVNTYYVSTGSTVQIFIGDPVVVNGTADADGVPAVVRATAGSSNYVTGVVVGVKPITMDSPVYREASTARYLMVCDDPDQLFEVQSNGTTAANNISANANFAAGAGGVATGLSGFVLNESTVGTTSSLQLRIVRSAPAVNNEIGLYGKYLVKFNLSSKRNLTGV